MKKMIEYIRFGIGQSIGRFIVNLGKLVAVVIIILVLGECCEAKAASYSPNTQYSLVNSSYTEYLLSLCRNDENREYVVFRSGQYTYTALSGDFDFKDGTLTGSGVVYEIDSQSGYGVTTNYIVKETIDENITYTPGSGLCYSNIRGLGATDIEEFQLEAIVSLLFVFTAFSFILAVFCLLRKRR